MKEGINKNYQKNLILRFSGKSSYGLFQSSVEPIGLLIFFTHSLTDLALSALLEEVLPTFGHVFALKEFINQIEHPG